MAWLKLVQRGVLLVLALFLLVSPTLFFMLQDHMDENPERWGRIKRMTLRAKIPGRNTEDVVEVPEWSLTLHGAPDHGELGGVHNQTDTQRSQRSERVRSALQKSRQIRTELGRIALETNSNSTRGAATSELGKDRANAAGFSGEGTGETADLAPSLQERLSQARAAIRQSAKSKQQPKPLANAKPAPLPAKAPAPAPAPALAADSARNLVLSTSVGVHDVNLAVFLGSLRAVAPACTILLFTETDPLSPRLQELLSKHAARSVHVPPEQRAAVWGLYHTFLRDKPSDFDNVLIASAADTAFQASPFGIVAEKAIYVSEEGRAISASGGAVIKDCFGEAVAADLGERKALWTASMVGSAAPMAGFLKRLAGLQEEASFAKCAPAQRAADRDPDAAAINVALHRSGSELRVQAQQDGPMALLGLKMALVNADGQTVTSKSTGRNPPVIHQYHLDKQLLASLIRKHVSFSFQEEKDGGGECVGYKLLSDIDAFAGFGDLGAGPQQANALDECCKVCTAKKAGGCVAFTWLPHEKQCWLKSNNRPDRDGPPIPHAVSAWVSV